MREIHRGTRSFVKGVHEERFRSVVPDAAELGAEGAVLQESSIILCMIWVGWGIFEAAWDKCQESSTLDH